MSLIDIPAGSHYGLNNLPYAVFSRPGLRPRVGVRIGDLILDLSVMLNDETFAVDSLNSFMAQGSLRWAEVRSSIVAAAETDVPAVAIYRVADVALHLPFDVGDYVDFYASEHHAANLGRLFRPNEAPLLPNWKHLPVGYHGRSGTIVVSGTGIVRPNGQQKVPHEAMPMCAPSKRLDIEAELGFVVGVGSRLGEPIGTGSFREHVFGVVLVNDWSARDIQAWEYVPLGPHLGKSFATSISPWVVPFAALEAAQVPAVRQHPPVLPYLDEAEPWGLDLNLSIDWNGVVVSRPEYRHMYWSPAQMLSHMTINGASVRTGDLFASGTVSGPTRDQCGSLMELVRGGAEPIVINGVERTFLADGDEVVITATAPGGSQGRIGFGEVRGVILPAISP